MIENKKALSETNVITALSTLKGKWIIPILIQICAGNIHFGTLLRSVPNINPRSLAHSLKFLENEGVLQKEDCHTIPPKFAYHLTPKGNALQPILHALDDWTNDYH